MDTLELYGKKIREQNLQNGALSTKEKELILIGMEAVTLKEESVLAHTKAAIDAGAVTEEIVEVLLAAIVTRGLTAWLVGVKAIEFAKSYSKKAPLSTAPDVPEINTIEEARTYLAGENGSISNWASLMDEYNQDALLNYTRLRNQLLKDNYLARKQKEFVIIGLNLALGYKTGIGVHIDAAVKEGATEEQIMEVFTTALTYIGLENINLN